MPIETPVAFFIFNRPDLTALVFKTIARAEPKKLFVIADGPRFIEEAAKCQAARDIIERVSWNCQVMTDYSERNLGCKARVASGLNWVFLQVDRAIVIEDDCLPHASFFQFCDELLEYYAGEDRVVHIGGANLVPNYKTVESYRFSRLFPSMGGWATWRRAWLEYDIEMNLWPEYRESSDLQYFGDQKDYVRRSFERVYSEHIDTWDTQWAFSCTINGGVSIIPKSNLLRNLGFRPDATHTKDDSWIASIPVRGLGFPLSKPSAIHVDPIFDQCYLARLSGTAPSQRSLPRRALDKFRSMLRRID